MKWKWSLIPTILYFLAIPEKYRRPRYVYLTILPPLLINAGTCCAFERQASSLANLSIEELSQITVTSVSKKAERLGNTSASIFVITQNAIQRAGARNIPEALRLAPNLLVAQINSNKYAISARGFNSNSANKLLVMIDGRTIYTPLYSGVFWDSQDVFLADVDRIEVISGPGGTLWGANAVNGVINIITKTSKSTHGNIVQASEGNTTRGFAIRHGGELNDGRANYRVYAKIDELDHSTRADGTTEPDSWHRGQLGFRSDWRDGKNDLTLQGDAYKNSIDQAEADRQKNSGANLLARWSRALQDASNLKVQVYFDHSDREIPGIYGEGLNILDIDAQHSFEKENGTRIIWGGGYRIANDHVENTAALAFLPEHKLLHWVNLFTQEEQDFGDNWQFTLGAKLERNDYTGVEFLPNFKLSWNPLENQFLWLGLARAVRAPSRIDRDIYIPGNAPYQLAGGPGFRSEIADTLELGWRSQATQNWSYSVTGFYSDYDHLRSINRLDNGVYSLGNTIEGRVAGLETSTNYQVSKNWSVDASALVLTEDFSGQDLALSSPGNDPHTQYTLTSKWDINSNKHFDISLRRVGKLPSPPVSDYLLLDIHFGWSPVNNIALGINGRNLLDRYHQEFPSGSGRLALNPIQVERSLDMSAVVRF